MISLFVVYVILKSIPSELWIYIHRISFILSIDEDLSDIEDDIYDDDELDEDCDDLSFIEMECPNCNDLVEIDEELLYDDEVDVVCPNCKAIILSSDDDDYSCTDCDCEE